MYEKDECDHKNARKEEYSQQKGKCTHIVTIYHCENHMFLGGIRYECEPGWVEEIMGVDEEN